MPKSTLSDQASNSLVSRRATASSHAVAFDRADVAVLAGELALVDVHLRNVGNLVEQYSVSIIGVPPDWVSLETSVVRLLPGDEQHFTIRIHPPEDAGSGDRHLTMIVNSASAGATSSFQLSVRVGSKIGKTNQNAVCGRHLESTHDTGDTTVVQANDDRYVFVSYSPRGRAYVDELCGWLRQRGVVVWIDSDIDYGTRWQTVVRDRRDAAAAVVVVMSPAAEESRWVEREVRSSRSAAGQANLPATPRRHTVLRAQQHSPRGRQR